MRVGTKSPDEPGQAMTEKIAEAGASGTDCKELTTKGSNGKKDRGSFAK